MSDLEINWVWTGGAWWLKNTAGVKVYLQPIISLANSEVGWKLIIGDGNTEWLPARHTAGSAKRVAVVKTIAYLERMKRLLEGMRYL